nr:non-specific lipid-transfer protein-like protein At5g64080 [Ipomoea trifida]
MLAVWAIAVVDCAHHAAPAPAADCGSVILNLADCLTFVTNGSTEAKPQGTCCSGLKTVLKTNAECLCEGFKNSAQLGVVLNVTKALALPSACHVSAPSVSNCGLNIGSISSPGSARASSTVFCNGTGGIHCRHRDRGGSSSIAGGVLRQGWRIVFVVFDHSSIVVYLVGGVCLVLAGIIVVREKTGLHFRGKRSDRVCNREENLVFSDHICKTRGVKFVHHLMPWICQNKLFTNNQKNVFNGMNATGVYINNSCKKIGFKSHNQLSLFVKRAVKESGQNLRDKSIISSWIFVPLFSFSLSSSSDSHNIAVGEVDCRINSENENSRELCCIWILQHIPFLSSQEKHINGMKRVKSAYSNEEANLNRVENNTEESSHGDMMMEARIALGVYLKSGVMSRSVSMTTHDITILDTVVWHPAIYNIGFLSEFPDAKKTLELLQGDGYGRTSHEAHNSSMRQEINQEP